MSWFGRYAVLFSLGIALSLSWGIWGASVEADEPIWVAFILGWVFYISAACVGPADD